MVPTICVYVCLEIFSLFVCCLSKVISTSMRTSPPFILIVKTKQKINKYIFKQALLV